MDVNFHIPIAVFWILLPLLVFITSWALIAIAWILANSKIERISKFFYCLLHAYAIVPFIVTILYLLLYKHFDFM